jgi:hypothetical protein
MIPMMPVWLCIAISAICLGVGWLAGYFHSG